MHIKNFNLNNYLRTKVKVKYWREYILQYFTVNQIPTFSQGKQSRATPGDEGQLHPGVICDGCDGAIRGKRFKCVTCAEYDLCASCEEKGTHLEHDMMLMRTPGSYMVNDKGIVFKIFRVSLNTTKNNLHKT